MRIPLSLLALALTLTLNPPAHADAPAAPAENDVADVRVQSLNGYNYAYVSTQSTINKVPDAVAQLLPKLDAAIDSGALHAKGPVVFTYHGATMDPNKPFILDIGIIVSDKDTAPAGIQMVKVPPLHCGTVIFTGAISKIGEAYGKLYGEIAKRGLQPTDICREVYLYWEGPDSVNNVVQVQAELQPPSKM
jgi:effector-binding domain-containing protein